MLLNVVEPGNQTPQISWGREIVEAKPTYKRPLLLPSSVDDTDDPEGKEANEEDATLLQMRKDGCSWEKISAALPDRSLGTIRAVRRS